VQRRANAMARVGPTPVKCHEPTAMALACSVTTPAAQYQKEDNRYDRLLDGLVLEF
jgi:hypothetical protein